MLSRAIRVATGLAALSAVAAVAALPAAAGEGGGSVVCPPNQDVCVITVHNPPGSGGGGNGGGNGGGSDNTCTWEGQQVPCHDDRYGWWSETDSCYYRELTPPPPAFDPSWGGHYPDGAVYQGTCLGAGGSGGWVWFTNPPDGYGGTPTTPAQLAARAVKRLPIDGPSIGIAPHPDGIGLVGLPVWLWTPATTRTWGPATATASVPGLSVTATARAERVVWSMGDGHSVTCASPGTPYTSSRDGAASPTCGYVYRQSSASEPGGKYTVTATTTWLVTWAGGGANGTVTVTRSSTVQVAIGELQVVVG